MFLQQLLVVSGPCSIFDNYHHCMRFTSLCDFVFVAFLDLKHGFLNACVFTLVCALSLGPSVFQPRFAAEPPLLSYMHRALSIHQPAVSIISSLLSLSGNSTKLPVALKLYSCCFRLLYTLQHCAPLFVKWLLSIR